MGHGSHEDSSLFNCNGHEEHPDLKRACELELPKGIAGRMVAVLFFAEREKIKGIGELLSSMGLADNECPKVIVR